MGLKASEGVARALVCAWLPATPPTHAMHTRPASHHLLQRTARPVDGEVDVLQQHPPTLAVRGGQVGHGNGLLQGGHAMCARGGGRAHGRASADGPHHTSPSPHRPPLCCPHAPHPPPPPPVAHLPLPQCHRGVAPPLCCHPQLATQCLHAGSHIHTRAQEDHDGGAGAGVLHASSRSSGSSTGGAAGREGSAVSARQLV